MNEQVKSNVLLGVIGALLGALAGSILWVVLYQIGIIASIAGIAIITLACKGYAFFSKKLDIKGVFLSLFLSVLVLIAAHFFCWGLEIYNTFKVDYEITIVESILAIPDMVFQGELILNFLKDLLIGLILIIVGVTPYLKRVFHERKVKINSQMRL